MPSDDEGDCRWRSKARKQSSASLSAADTPVSETASAKYKSYGYINIRYNTKHFKFIATYGIAIQIKQDRKLYLMKILSATFTITTEINVRKETPVKMPVSLRTVLSNQLQNNIRFTPQSKPEKTNILDWSLNNAIKYLCFYFTILILLTYEQLCITWENEKWQSYD